MPWYRVISWAAMRISVLVTATCLSGAMLLTFSSMAHTYSLAMQKIVDGAERPQNSLAMQDTGDGAEGPQRSGADVFICIPSVHRTQSAEYLDQLFK